MSIELVLLILAFLLLPLVQRLVSAARAGQEARPAQPAGPQSSASVPPLREVNQLLVTEDRTLTDVTTAPERKPVRNADRPVTPVSRRPGRAVVGLRDALDLRRAIVLRTVLGPCRANRPPDWLKGAPGAE
jgi:hypothetical protein